MLKIIVREAKAADKEPLMTFVEKIWGGQDYVPGVWDDWLRDARGKIFVVEVEGRLVGMNHLRFLGDGTGWLEGARIRPSFRGRGLASLLGSRSMEYASEFGITRFRLTSSSRNKAAYRHVIKMGFSEVTRFEVLGPEPKSRLRPQVGVTRLSTADAGKTLKLIRGSDEYKASKGVYWDAFVAHPLDRRALSELLTKRCVYSASDRMGKRAIAICGEVKEGKEKWQQISFICGELGPSQRLVSHLLRGGGRRVDERFLFLPKGSRLLRSMREIGLRKRWEMILFEKRIDQELIHVGREA
jgi:GNAT superfamily N-acetyltransferase